MTITVEQRDVEALRYLLNWADSGSRVRTIMRTFTEDKETTQDCLERLYAALSAKPAASLRPASDDLREARSLIECIAEWERENGTLAAIMPHEYEGFCERISRAARKCTGSSRGAHLPHPSEQPGEMERLREALRKIESTPAWGYPDRWETTPAEVRQLARATLNQTAAGERG